MAKYKHKIPINDRVIISQRHFFGINKASLINDIFAVNDLVAKVRPSTARLVKYRREKMGLIP